MYSQLTHSWLPVSRPQPRIIVVLLELANLQAAMQGERRGLRGAVVREVVDEAEIEAH
jgi:hypothetical protein